MNETKTPARILVDDEDTNRRLLVAMLEAEGYATTEATGGEQAIERARQNPPDMALLDIMMPGVDGYQAACTLKAAEATRPVLRVRAKNLLKLNEYGDFVADLNRILDAQVKERTR